MEYKKDLFPFGFPTKLVVLIFLVFGIIGAIVLPLFLNLLWWHGFLLGIGFFVLIGIAMTCKSLAFIKEHCWPLAVILGGLVFVNQASAMGFCIKSEFPFMPFLVAGAVFLFFFIGALILSIISEINYKSQRNYAHPMKKKF